MISYYFSAIFQSQGWLQQRAVTCLLAWRIRSTLPSSSLWSLPQGRVRDGMILPPGEGFAVAAQDAAMQGAGGPAQHQLPVDPLAPALSSRALVSVLPPACPPSLHTVPICLAFTVGWSRGCAPGLPVHNGSLFTTSLRAHPSPALAIIPISCALSLLPICTTDPCPSCSVLVAATLLPTRGHLQATRMWALG